ncbi:MAG TPA: hypothetical protein VNJ70_07085 [Thermoanaerobaculia bacterium]|nr:hypothetical protein [Thermoanaerobaculia bacterium]
MNQLSRIERAAIIKQLCGPLRSRVAIRIISARWATKREQALYRFYKDKKR